MKDEQELVRFLSNGVISNDLQWLLTYRFQGHDTLNDKNSKMVHDIAIVS